MNSLVAQTFTETSYPLSQRLTVRALVRTLPEIEQHVVYMRFWDSWAMYEIAEFLEISVVEAEQALERALKRLRALCLMTPAFETQLLVAA